MQARRTTGAQYKNGPLNSEVVRPLRPRWAGARTPLNPGRSLLLSVILPKMAVKVCVSKRLCFPTAWSFIRKCRVGFSSGPGRLLHEVWEPEGEFPTVFVQQVRGGVRSE